MNVDFAVSIFYRNPENLDVRDKRPADSGKVAPAGFRLRMDVGLVLGIRTLTSRFLYDVLHSHKQGTGAHLPRRFLRALPETFLRWNRPLASP